MSKFETLLNAVRKTQELYAKYGATDSEPDYEIHKAMQRAMEDGVIELPTNWQLYTDTMSCTKAEKALNKALFPLLEYLVEVGQISTHVRNYCWRVY